MKKQYTVVYSNYSQCGSHHVSITLYKKITCEENKIEQCVNKHGIEMSQVWFIFEGHCIQQGEKAARKLKSTNKRKLAAAPTEPPTKICPMCDGYGQFTNRAADLVKCSVCNGTGKLLVA